MIKKYVVYIYGKKEKYTFAWIKKAIAESPMIYNRNFM